MDESLKSLQYQILIIDDSLNNLHVLYATLKQAGYKTRGVKNSKMALISIQASPPDLILLDIKMPGLDGYEVCQRLKANPDICNIPVIFISALDQPIDLVKAFEVGGCDYITKPFQIEAVLVRIKHQLRIRTLEKQLNEQNRQLQHEIKQQEIAQKALQESEEKFSKAFLLSPNPMAIAKYPQGGFIDVNQAFLEIAGYTKSEILERDPIELNLFVNTRQRDRLPVLLKTHQRIHNYELQIQTKTLENRTVILSAELLNLQDKWYVLCLFNDITEQKKIEQERNHVLKQLQERIQLEKVTRQVVERMRRTLDIEQILRSITEDIRQTLECDRVGIFRFNPDWSGEFVAESVRKGWNSVLELEELVTHALESDRCYVKLYTQDHQSLLDTYLRETEGGIYRNNTPYMCVPNVQEAGFDPCYLDLLHQFQAQAYITVPLFTETRLWGLLACYQNDGPRLWKDSEIHFIVAIAEQLGVALQQAKLLERAQQQSQELTRARNLAETANQTKSEFLAKMTHELRTPLNAILGFTQLLQQNPTLSAKVQEDLTTIHHSGDHLLSMINDILDMAKFEAGDMRVHSHTFDLYQCLDTLKTSIELRAFSKGLTFELIVDTNVPQFIETDAAKLRQVLLNLLDNSLKFTVSGGIILRVSSPLDLRFEIEDTGVGISSEALSTLFNPFSNPPSQDGTGLGLALSQQLVNLIGGQIQVKSQLGHGSRFIIEIPLQLPNPNTMGNSSFTSSVIGLAPNQPNYRILVIEENWVNRQHWVNLLQSVGFEVREATQTEEAIALWENWSPHLIFMNLQMSALDSYTVTQKIRSMPKGRDTIIIALTPQCSSHKFTDLTTMGWDDLIGEPIQDATIWQKIAQHLPVSYQYATPDSAYEFHPTSTSISDVERDFLESRIAEADLGELQEELRQMPLNWIEELHQAACKGSDLTILNLIKSIPSQFTGLADRLTHWANDFQFDQIIYLVEPIKLSQN